MYINKELEQHIKDLLLENQCNEYWEKKIINSVLGIKLLFKKNIDVNDVTKETLSADNIWIVSPEELEIEYAKYLINNNDNKKLYPVTIIRCKNQNILFMGSTRSLCLALQDLPISAIVVKMDDIENTNFFNRKVYTLKHFIDINNEELKSE